MRLLLDTNVILRLLHAEVSAADPLRDVLGGASETSVSALAFAEIGIKASIGKLVVPDDIERRLRDIGTRTLALTAAHGLAVADLPLHHRDPFDRLLVAQARLEGFTILTSDEQLAAYDVPVVLA